MKLNWKRSLIFVLLVILPTGCSQIKFVYDHSGWLLRQRINSYTQFTEDQQKQIRSEIDKYFDLHRKKILPMYVAYLRQVDRQLETSALQTTQVKENRREFMRLVRETLRPMIHPAAQILSTLATPQIDLLEKTSARQNEKFREEWLSGDQEQRLQKRAARTVNSIEDWSGQLTRFQVEKVKRLNKKLPYMTQIWLDNRIAKQAQAIQMLRAHAEVKKLEQYFSEWQLEAESHRPAAQIKQFEAFNAALDQFIVDVWNLLDEKQQVAVHKKLKNYAQDFAELFSEMR